MQPIEFRSDNTAAAAPELIDALVRANTGPAPAYGDDRWTAELTDRVREVFEHPTAMVFPVSTGTAANALGLSALCAPWGAVLCHETAHILRSEAGATSQLTGGAQLIGLPGAEQKLTPTALEAAFAAVRWGDPHHSQPMVVSFTCPTDQGSVYSADEVRAVMEVARGRGLRGHLDGARLANALVAEGCAPADLTWRAGIDVVSLGATKNGALSTDAIVCFDDAAAEQLHYRVKRAGQVASKMRYQSAQLIAYLTDGVWLRLASDANARMHELALGLQGVAGVSMPAVPRANMLFVDVRAELADAMAASGLRFHTMADPTPGRPGWRTIRLVTSWQTTVDDIAAALARINRAAAA